MDFAINHYRRRPVQPDILKGAAAIAEFLFGAKHRRREVYYLVERDSLPHFKLGSMICARPTTLEAWIARQERDGLLAGSRRGGS